MMAVPCCDFLYGQCACNFIKIWSDNADYNKKCPMSGNFLIDQILAKFIQYNMTCMTQSTIFLWIPTFISMGKKFE